MSTTDHESEVVQVQGLKASLKKGGNKGIYNEAICSTAGGTAAKVTNTVPPSFSLKSGATIIVKFTYAISVADATLKVGDADAKPIYYQGAALLANKVKAGTSLLLRYNGTVWNIIGMLGNDSAAAYTPTLSSAPTSSTTTYTKDGETLPFEIGQFCRVADASMDTGYKFYQLADLSNGVAAWQEMGTALERVTISVTSNQSAAMTSTLRSSAVIRVEDEDGQQVYSGTMPQSTMVKMTPGKRYTISAGSVSGFTAPQPQTIDAEYEGVHSIDMEYQTELVSVSLSKNTGSGDLSGVGITIKDSSDNTLGSGTGSITDLTVAYGTQYHVVLTDSPDYYIAPDTSTVYTAGQQSRSIALQYTEYSQGQVTVVPEAKTLTYNGEAQELVTAGQGTGTMMYKLGDGEWSSSIPTATAAGSYEVKYKAAAEGTYYESAEGTVSVSIAKANPSYTAPTAKIGLVYSGEAQTLLNAGSTSDGEISYSSDGTTWGQNIPTATDANESIAVYWKLTGDSNHNDVASTLVSVSIAKADITPYVSMAGWTYGGTESNPSVSGNTGGGEVSYLYKVQGAADSTYTTGKPSDAGDYTIKAEIAATSNYNAGTATADFTIAKAAPSYTAPTGKSLTYNGSMQDLLNEGSTAHGTMKYSSDGSTWSASVPQGQNAGEYTLYWKIEGDSNHSDIASTEISASVAKVTPTVIIPTAKVLVYNTSAQELVNAGSSDFGTMKYSLDGTDYSTSIPTATDYGTYTVYYKVDGDSNVNSTAAATVACSISEKEVSTPTIELTPSSFTYSGSACTPTVVVKDGSHVIPSSEYTVTFSNNTNAGTATVTIADNTGGNYNITGSTTFNIAKADPTYTAPTAKSGLVYDNTDKALLNAASNVAGGTVKYSSDGTSWSTSIPTGKNAGSYSPQWKIEGDSNHNDKAAAAISVSIAKVTPTVTAPTAKSLTFTGSAQTLANAGSTNWGTLQYSSDNSSWSTSIPTGTNAGTSYKVYYRVVGDSNINDVASASINCSIGKASPSYTAPTAKTGLVYTGSAQALLNAGSTSHGTIQYSSDNSNWSSTIPSQTNANTSGYTSYWRLVGDSNHSDVASTSLKTTIAKASLSASVSMSGWTYGGTASSPSVSGNSGSGSVTYSYKVEGAADSTYTSTKPSNAGSYTVRAVIAETTNYNGTTVTTNFTIAKASQSAPTAYGASVGYGNTATATASGGGGQGSIEWSNGGSLSGNVGSKTTKARWSGNSNYNASAWSNEVTLAITKIDPTITAPTAKSGLTYSGSSQTLYNAGSNTTAGSFSYSNGTRTNAGSQTVSWSFTPSDTTNYNSKSGSFTGSIAKAAGSISFTSAPSEVEVGASITVAASRYGDGTISFSSSNTSLATVSGSTVTGVAEGTVTIYASVAEGTNYTSASTSYTLDVYNPIMYAYVTIDQSQSGETSMITVRATENGSAQTLNASTGEHANAALQTLRDSSHLYMGTFANSKMTLRQLKDNDGTKYLDGTTAKFDGTEGDHFLRIGEPFYIKRTSGSDSGNQVTYGIAVGGQPDNTWKQIITPNDLLGVHEAYIASSMLYSRSGVQSGASQTRDTFKTYARNRGTGFTCVTWEWHCVMALLFYAWYGRTNAQAQCGTGGSSYRRTLGTKDSFGMTDTTSANGNADNTKFWGIENWWGDKYEWIDNVDVNNRKWTVKDINGNTKRTNLQAGSSDGYIQKLMLSENLDLIPTGVGGSDTTYFCDYYYQNSGSRVVARSCGRASACGGVACVVAYCDSSWTDAGIGSRLAFNGEIEIA